MTLDDKVSILEIKAWDDQGRLYNLEMQMLATAALVQRFAAQLNCLVLAQVNCRATWKEEQEIFLPSSRWRIRGAADRC